MKELAGAIAHSLGMPGKTRSITLDEAMTMWGPFAGPMAANGRLSSEKARRVLGWAPHAPTRVDELERGSYAAVA